GLNHTEVSILQFRCSIFNKRTQHIFLPNGNIGIAPGAGSYPETFRSENGSRGVGPLVMPIADDDVFVDPVDSLPRIVVTTFPHSNPGSPPIDQSIAPHP